MINTRDNIWIPSDGYKYISNDEVWTDNIMLGKNDNIVNWHDTNEEPPVSQEPEEEISDEEALSIIMGGTL